jgi:tetratricopeptide (TPR) repeat protein
MSRISLRRNLIATLFLITATSAVPALAQSQTSEPKAIDLSENGVAKNEKPKIAPLAISDYEKLITEHPDDVVAQNNLGALLYRSGRFDEAAEVIQRAADARPDMWNIQVNASVALAHQGSYAIALKYVESAYKIAPEQLRVREQLCDMYLAVRDGAAAVPCYRSLVTDGKGDPEDLLGYARALIITGDAEGAEAASREVIQSSPTVAEAHNVLGMALYKKKHYKESVEAFREAIRLAPEESGYRFNMALTEIAVRDRPGALSQYNLLKRSDPKLGDQLYKMIFADQLVAVGR